METDPRFLRILHILAKGELVVMGEDERYCPFCSAGEYMAPDHEATHATDCPVALARELLRELGHPMKLYCLSLEIRYPERLAYIAPGWKQIEDFHIVQSMEEIDVKARIEQLLHSKNAIESRSVTLGYLRDM